MKIQMKRWMGSLMGAVLAVSVAGCATARESTVDELIKAQLELAQGRRDVALARLSAAIEKNPQLALPWQTRGEIFKQSGDYRQAARDFEQATRLEPYNFNAHYQLGLMYQYLKQFADAIKAYQKAVEIRPLDADANMNLAVAYSESGNPMQGLKYAQSAVNGAQDNAKAHANLGAMYGQLGYSDLAVDEYKRAIELDPRLTGVYLNLANEYLKQSKWEQGRQVLEGAAAQANTAAVSERLGYAYYKLGRIENAQSAYQDSLKISPSYYQSMNGLGVISMTRALATSPADVSQAKEALAFWRRSLQVEPNQPVIQRLLAKYAGTGNPPAETQSSGVSDANPKPGT